MTPYLMYEKTTLYQYGNNAPGGITSHMLCASLPDKDSCSVSYLILITRTNRPQERRHSLKYEKTTLYQYGNNALNASPATTELQLNVVGEQILKPFLFSYFFTFMTTRLVISGLDWGRCEYVFHILPQIYTVNHATFPMQMYVITVQICGNYYLH